MSLLCCYISVLFVLSPVPYKLVTVSGKLELMTYTMGYKQLYV